jgi:predicted dehydrogenase
MNRRNFLAGSLGLGYGAQKTYRIAIFGCTGRGEYGHDLDTVWLDVPNAKVAAVADADNDGRDRAKHRLNAPAAYADFRELLSREKPDIVSICPRWPDQHLDMALACAESGVRGIFMEKPIARDLNEADRIVAACERSGMKLAIAYQTRYSPRTAVAKRLISDGRLGELLEIRCRGKEDRRGGGEDLAVLGTHLFDLVRYFAGNPKWCFARVTDGGKTVTRKHVRQGAEALGLLAGDSVTAIYGFDSALTASFGTHRAKQSPGARFGLSLYGTRGALSMGTGTLPPTYFLDDASWTLFQGGGKWQAVSGAGVGFPESMTDSSHRAGNRLIAQDLIQCIESGKQPLASVYDGRGALEMVMAVYESHRQNAPVNLPLTARQNPLELLK